jgi:hypothetical protein
MFKRFVLAVIAVFAVWSVIDFVLHNIILQSAYQETAHLWRPMEEMKIGLMHLVTLVAVVCFVAVYTFFIQPKKLSTGMYYGLIFGLGGGISMGLGTYSFLPMPLFLGLVWFLGFVIETVIGGLIMALIIKEQNN